MASIIALVSKAVFEKEHPAASVGATLPFTLYTSSNRTLETLTEGGDLYLVTVRPGEKLWLVGVLRGPRFTNDAWRAAESSVPVTDVGSVVAKLRFTSGKGISQEPGKLGMSLQTPRVLTGEDVRELEALLGGTAPKPAVQPAVQPDVPPATKPATKPASKPAPDGVPVGTPWASAPPRPASVPAHAAYDAIDRRWIEGTRAADGSRTGSWTEWREDGSLYLTTHYEGGLTHGTQRELHPDGSLANEATWVRGVQKETTICRAKSGETDSTLWKDVHARIVRIVSVPDEDGLGWRTGVLFDADGVEVTPLGETSPPRPAGVPETARYATFGDQPAWVDGTTQYTSHLPVGRRRCWSATGVLMEEAEYTSWGRHIWKREALDPDPQAARIDAFIADPSTFSPGYELGQHWTPEVHETMRARLREASSKHVAAYLEVLDERVEWHLAERAPEGLTACGLAIVDDWLGRKATDEGAAAIHAWALAKRIDLFDRDAVRALLASGRALLEKDATDHAEVLEQATALAEGKTDRALDALEKKLATSRAAATGEDILNLARRALRAPKLDVLLGDPTKGELLLTDERRRAYLYDGHTFAPAPLAIDTSERRHTTHFQAFDKCDERRLFLSGQHVWWTFTRYGWTIHVQGSQYFSSRGQGESIVSALVRCPDAGWVARVRAIFEASVPAAASEVHPFYLAKKGWLFAWAYDSSLYHPFGNELSRGIDGATIVNTSGSPGVLRLHMIDKKPNAKPKPLEECESEADAIERFNRFEVKLLRHGYRLDRIVALPVREPVKVTKTKADDKPAPAPPVLVRDVAPSVAAELKRAVAASSLAEKIEALRAAWVKRPAKALADALDALDAQTPALPAIAGKSKPAMAAWDAIEKARDPATFGRLLASLADVPSTVVQPRLERLGAWPTDPRLDRALIAIAWSIPFTSSGTQSVWRRIFARLGESDDARILEQLWNLSARYKKMWSTVTGAWAREVIGKIVEKRAPTLQVLGALTLDAEDTRLLAELLAGGTMGGGADDLLAQIFASPEDNSRRLAYAEAAGPKDLRAEHIVLGTRDSLDKAGKARLAELEREHASELAGPLAKYLKKGARFERGFLVEAARTSGLDMSEELAASPWWSTVEDLDVGTDMQLQSSKALVSLKTLRGAMFATGGDRRGSRIEGSPVRPRVTTLELTVHVVDGLTEVFRSNKFPALEALSISLGRCERPALAWLEEPAARRLAQITVVQDVSGGGDHDRTSVNWLAALWEKAVTSHPNLATIAGKVHYRGGESRVDYRIERVDPKTANLTVRSATNLRGWWTVLQDNLCLLLETLSGLGCRTAQLDIKLAPDDLVAAVNESARIANVDVAWRAGKS